MVVYRGFPELGKPQGSTETHQGPATHTRAADEVWVQPAVITATT